MCGIGGIVAAGHAIDEDEATRMLESQQHRGPDGEGKWIGCAGARQVALVHNRLSILDLTPAGRQPMTTPDGRFVLVYNGEIFNYLEVRSELARQGAVFRTRSDAEVLLQALVRWGPDALPRLNGMWSFALLDREGGTLLLSRDRLGEKPLYLLDDGSRLYFASEIKAILAASQRRFRINALVASRYLEQQQFDAQPETFFEGIRSFPAAAWLRLDLNARSLRVDDTRVYWKLPQEDRFVGSDVERIAAVRETIFDSVRLRHRSDVPVGVLLSGGLDSSAIAVATRRVFPDDAGAVAVFAAVSDSPEFSEEKHIDRVATHLGLSVRKVRFAPTEALFDEVDRATFFNDEPIGGLANVAHRQLVQRARADGVPVLLSGQGADELTCGYLKYIGFHMQDQARRGRLLALARTAASSVRNADLLRQFSLADARRYLPWFFRPAMADVRGAAAIAASHPLVLGMVSSVVDRQADDLTRLSVPALLHFEDRMSMSEGCELRTPFLDYRFVELMQPMPVEWKLRGGWTKWILRQAMATDLPDEIVWRRDKKGFATPENLWVARELRPAIESILREPMLTADWGLVNQPALARRYEQYVRRWGGPFAMRAQDILGAILLERWARVFETSLKA